MPLPLRKSSSTILGRILFRRAVRLSLMGPPGCRGGRTLRRGFRGSAPRGRNVDRLQLQAAGVLDVASLVERLEDGRPQAISSGIVTGGHVLVPLPAAVEEALPELVR